MLMLGMVLTITMQIYVGSVTRSNTSVYAPSLGSASPVGVGAEHAPEEGGTDAPYGVEYGGGGCASASGGGGGRGGGG